MGLFKKKDDAATKRLKELRKREVKETYDRELHKANIRQAKKRAKLDAKKGKVGFMARLESGFSNVSAGLEGMNKSIGSVGLFSDFEQPKPKTKKVTKKKTDKLGKKKPKKVVYYF